MAISKWIFLGLLLAGSTLFFREAAGTSLSGTLSRTGLAGANIGTGIQETLTGVGTGFSKLLNPFFSFADLIGKFQTVLGGGGGFDSSNNSGGGITTQTITSRTPSGGGTSTLSTSTGGLSIGNPTITPSTTIGGIISNTAQRITRPNPRYG